MMGVVVKRATSPLYNDTHHAHDFGAVILELFFDHFHNLIFENQILTDIQNFLSEMLRC